MAHIEEAETQSRVALLKRFRQLLVMQRERFRTYLETLDLQKNLIENGTVEELSNYVELEEKIAGDIFSLQKVIEPLQGMYRFAWNGLEPPEIPEIQTVVENLKNEAKNRLERNKTLLQDRMALIRNEIKELRASPYRRRRSAYTAAAPSLIDVQG
ncbi:MAG: flagellar export chaperone FlgN [Spirochaetaceae bacterium]|jgi:hypothetical protein|nr:flagellar export chaperone FlgN [Spirochaetaceae bacterium]